MSTNQILFAGFGGQGILFSGKFLAYYGLHENKQVSWLPSYGPEMRGGTANCHVIISDMPIGTPIIINPDMLVAMNAPSLDKFEKDVVAGGKIFIDSTLIERKCVRDDVNAFYVPATRLASENGIATLANMIIIGKLIKESDIIDFDKIPDVLKQLVPASKPELLDLNMKALRIGYEYEG